MALNHRTLTKPSEPLLHAPVRASRDFIFTSFHALHIDAHVPIDGKTVFRAAASDMGCIGTCNERFCGDTPRIHARSTKLVPFNNCHGHVRRGKPRSQSWASLAGTDDNRVEVLSHNTTP